MPIQVDFGKKNKLECVTSDISIEGVKFRLAKPVSLSVGQTVDIEFSGLSQEFQFGKQSIFTYEIRNVQTIDSVQLVGVERVYVGSNIRDGFKQFLKGYIQGNKRRYKINLDNTYAALQSRTYEQAMLHKVAELPIFLMSQQEVLQPRYFLTCPNNQPIAGYWKDEQGHSVLDFLLD